MGYALALTLLPKCFYNYYICSVIHYYLCWSHRCRPSLADRGSHPRKWLSTLAWCRTGYCTFARTEWCTFCPGHPDTAPQKHSCTDVPSYLYIVPPAWCLCMCEARRSTCSRVCSRTPAPASWCTLAATRAKRCTDAQSCTAPRGFGRSRRPPWEYWCRRKKTG